jgi:hypothetical protein
MVFRRRSVPANAGTHAVKIEMKHGDAHSLAQHIRRWLWVPAFAGTTNVDVPHPAPYSSASTSNSRVRVTSGQSRLKSATSRFMSALLTARSSEGWSANWYVA